MKQEYKKLLTNTGLLTIGNFSSRILGLFLIPFYTTVLSTADYGVADIITTTTALIFPFATVAVSEAIMRFSLDKGSDKSSIYTIGLSIVTIGILLLVCAWPIILKTPLGEYIYYFYLYFIFYCLHTITSYFVKGLEKTTIFSLSGVLSTVVTICSNIIFLLVLKVGVRGYLISMILSHAVTLFFLVVIAKLYRYVKAPWRVELSLLKGMLKYSIPIIPNSISWWVANSSDKYVLTAYNGLTAVGLYSVAHKIPTMFITFMQLFISAWQLSAVEDFGSEKSKCFFSDIYNKFFCLNIFIASFLIITSKPIACVLFSNDFFVAYKFAPFLILSSVFDALASFMGSIYISAKKSKMLAISTVAGASINIVLNFLLIPQFSIMGAAIATAFSYFIIWVIRLINTRKIMIFKIKYKRDVFLLLLLVIQGCLVVVDSWLGYFICIGIVAVCAYFASRTYSQIIKVFFLKIFNKNHKRRI